MHLLAAVLLSAGIADEMTWGIKNTGFVSGLALRWCFLLPSRPYQRWLSEPSYLPSRPEIQACTSRARRGGFWNMCVRFTPCRIRVQVVHNCSISSKTSCGTLVKSMILQVCQWETARLSKLCYFFSVLGITNWKRCHWGLLQHCTQLQAIIKRAVMESRCAVTLVLFALWWV